MFRWARLHRVHRLLPLPAPEALLRPPIVAAIALAIAACSPKTLAVNLVADALSGGGGVYASDPDPDLVREALPFGLKTYEGLLESTPEHHGLLLATAKGFTAYAYMLADDADRMGNSERASAQRARAKALFLRGRDYALRGLESRHPGFTTALRAPDADPLLAMTAEDAGLLYWAGASWAGAIAADKQDFMLLADLGLAAKLVQRVVELDDGFDRGAAHQFLISYEGGRPAGDREAARAHYNRVVELSGGGSAGVHVALAETVAVAEQDLTEFRRLIDLALAVDLAAFPEQRVANALAQRRARWLLTQTSTLFFDAAGDVAAEGTQS